MRPTPAIRKSAVWILERELEASGDSPEELAAAIARAFTRVEERMVSLVGVNGFRALLDRAVHLAEPEPPWVADGARPKGARVSVPGLSGGLARLGRENAVDSAGALLANVLALLCAFIGTSLTHRTLCRTWPELPPLEATANGEEA